MSPVSYARIVLLLALFSCASVICFGQNPGSSRGLSSGEGANMIMGRVHFPAGQKVDSKLIKVHLESSTGFGSQTGATDEDGVFIFRDLPPGSYTVVVDGGKSYETARETVLLG